jgi:uncharacterized protein with PQ loop repeat
MFVKIHTNMIKKAKYIKITPSEYKKLLANNWRNTFDKLIVILGLVNVIATVPQITQIWQNQDASGVSLITWAYYVIFTAILLVYAVLIKAKPMIIMYTGNSIVYSIVLAGVIIF